MATAVKHDDLDEAHTEHALREDLACAYRLVAHMGWDDLIFTHLSARVPGPEHHFLLNPFDRGFEEITASSLVKVDMQGKPVDDAQAVVNPAGFTIHSAVHMARPDARCVMHLHTYDGQAVSAMDEGLLPLNQTALSAVGDMAYHGYEGVALDHDERERIVADLGDHHFMLLRNHGTLTVGEEVGDAFLRMYFLERACTIQVRTLAAGRDAVSLAPQGTVEKVAAQNKGMAEFVSRQLTWPMLRRRMDRLDDSYRD